MRIIPGILFFLISFIVFTSCQKEIEGSLPAETQNDSTDLLKVIVLDTNLAPGQDTAFIVHYTYDHQKRMASEEFTEVDYTTNTYYTFYYRYFYNNSDTLPFRVLIKYNFSTDSMVTYLTYNNGFIVKDSTVEFVSGTVSTIWKKVFSTVTANKYLLKETEYDASGDVYRHIDSTIYTRSVIAGNLSSGLDSTWQGDILSPLSLSEVNSFQFTHDNNINPLNKAILWYWGNYDSFDDAVSPNSNGVNNLLTANYSITYPSSSSENYHFSYSYNSSGYPSIGRASGTDGNKVLFLYTKL
ncbi:MAG: hypothetical protein HZA79_17055 [Sphingobacteriales bacterium]|nr:hypothetical protein [Sphingobacteriales bacterium]